MAYSSYRTFRPTSKDRLSYRYRQAVIFLAVIVIGMIISAAVNAIPSKKSTVATKVVQTQEVAQQDTN